MPPGSATSLAAYQDTVCLLGDERWLFIYDVSQSPKPKPVCRFELPSPGADVAATGEFAYVGLKDGGLKILDIQDKADPQDVGNLSFKGSIREIVVEGKRLFVDAAGEGIAIYDLSIPRFPVLQGRYSYGVATPKFRVSDTMLYVAAAFEGVQIVNIRYPFSPIFTSVFWAPEAATDVAINGDWLYVYDKSEQILILDVKDPRQPKLVSTNPAKGRSTNRGLKFHRNHLYVHNGGKIHCLDIDNPDLFQIVHTYESGSIQDFAFSGDSLLAADWKQGLKVFELTEGG